MARIKQTGGDLTGKIGTLSYFKRKDMEGVIVRSKGGPSKRMVKSSPSFDLTRRHNMEFGAFSKMGTQIRHALGIINKLSDYNTASTLNSLSSIILKKESTGELGQRSILLSQNRDMLKGFSFNQINTLDSYFRGLYSCEVERESLSAKIVISPITPLVHLKNCEQFQLFRWILEVGVVADVVFSKELNGYKRSVEDISRIKTLERSPWLAINDAHEALTLEISNTLNRDLSSSETIVVALGIEFGKSLSDSVVVPLNRVGAGKIVMVV